MNDLTNDAMQARTKMPKQLEKINIDFIENKCEYDLAVIKSNKWANTVKTLARRSWPMSATALKCVVRRAIRTMFTVAKM